MNGRPGVLPRGARVITSLCLKLAMVAETMQPKGGRLERLLGRLSRRRAATAAYLLGRWRLNRPMQMMATRLP